MEHWDVVVVGGSAAGLTAAITARRHYPDKRTLLIRREERVLIPCGIPYIFGTVGALDKDLIPDGLLTQNGIELLVDEVVGLDREGHTVTTAGGRQIGYERLVLATGSLPVMPPVAGFDKPNVYAIYKDAALLEALQRDLQAARRVVVVGGGFIGVEIADECNKLANVQEVRIVEMLPHCLLVSYDEEFCTAAEDLLRERGIHVHTGSKVSKVIGDGRATGVLLDSGETLEADAVILGIGATASVELARKAGLPLGPTGSVQVDRTMRTEDERVFACGDCAEKVSFFGGKPSPLKLASIACAEARIAGANLYGIRRENVGTVGVWSTALGDTAFATAGLTENLARRHGYDFVIGVSEGPDRHPGCMPGASVLKVKLLFERRTRVIIGAQIMGGRCAGEMINIASACIQRRMTLDDVAAFQMGTHPALTASPIAYQFVNAAEAALQL